MAEPRWIAAARAAIGTTEIPGRRSNPTIVKWWSLIRAPFQDDETPWCAGFVGGMLESVGIKSSRSAAARSYLNWGRALPRPAVGCIVVFSRGPRNGHVGFVVGKDAAGNLMVLGGNQGDAVNIKPFSRQRVLGYRWPNGEPAPRGYDYELPILGSDGRVSTREASADDVLDGDAPTVVAADMSGGAPEADADDGIVGTIKKWMHGTNAAGTGIGALVAGLYDWRVAIVVAVVGLIIFFVIRHDRKRK